MTIQSALKACEAALSGNETDVILALYGREPVFMPQHAPALVGEWKIHRDLFATTQPRA